MNIKLDENITAIATKLFVEFGHDCETVGDEGLTGAAVRSKVAEADVEGHKQALFLAADASSPDASAS